MTIAHMRLDLVPAFAHVVAPRRRAPHFVVVALVVGELRRRVALLAAVGADVAAEIGRMTWRRDGEDHQGRRQDSRIGTTPWVVHGPCRGDSRRALAPCRDHDKTARASRWHGVASLMFGETSV